MTDVLARHSRDPWRLELRRLAIGAVALVLAAGAWRLVRAVALYPVAVTSVGCPGRGPLLAAALRQKGFDVSRDARLFDWERPYDEQDLTTHSLPRPGWVAWSEFLRRLGPDWRDPSAYKLTVVDNRLRFRGSLVCYDTWTATAPADYDGDGYWELRTGFTLYDEDRQYQESDLAGLAVIRMAEDHNEIAWVGAVDGKVWQRPRPSIWAIWRDEDGDGSVELVLASCELHRRAEREWEYLPARAIAVFEWTKPGGVLVPRKLPDEGGILLWRPDPPEPKRIPRDAEIEPVLRSLIEIPERAKR